MDEDLTFLWLQRFHGNVTIIPRASLDDYPRLLSDPTPERMAHYMDGGRRRTWPKLHMIANRMMIERKIALCRRRLRREQLTTTAALIAENNSNRVNAVAEGLEDEIKVERIRVLLSGIGSGSEVDLEHSQEVENGTFDVGMGSKSLNSGEDASDHEEPFSLPLDTALTAGYESEDESELGGYGKSAASSDSDSSDSDFYSGSDDDDDDDDEKGIIQ
jgi:hypothetical protein